MTTAFAKHQRWFSLLDRLFWLAWIGLPVMIWVSLAISNDPGRLQSQLPPGLAQCASLMPDPAKMSAAGKWQYWGLLLFQVSIYVVLLGYLHLMVHRFARGRIFVGETLVTLRNLGVILIAWPFLETLVTNLLAAGMKATGDLPVYVPGYVIDVAPIAVGLFLLALRYAIDHAIAMKSENDLTI